MKQLIDTITKGYGIKQGKRGPLVLTAEGKSLDTLLEIKGRGDKQYVAVISKHCKPPIRVTSAKDAKAARDFLAKRTKEVSAAELKAKAVAPKSGTK
jgi:hypothetical protein